VFIKGCSVTDDYVICNHSAPLLNKEGLGEVLLDSSLPPLFKGKVVGYPEIEEF